MQCGNMTLMNNIIFFRLSFNCSNLRHCRTFSQSDVREPKRFYDAVIIGGGHNGLVAAAYLQKSGLRTCVLEKRHIVGGAAVTEEIVPGFKFSRASYVLSLLRPHIYKDLELKKYGLKVYPRNPSSYTPIIETKWSNNGPRSLTLGLEEESNKKQIARFSEKDAQMYSLYEDELGKVASAIEPLFDLSVVDVMEFLEAKSAWKKLSQLIRKPNLARTARSLSALGKDVPALYELLTAPATHILDRWFESEPLKATLATDGVIGTMAGPDTIGSGHTLLHHCMGEINGVRGGWGYPEGGMGAVTQAMASAASSFGADIFTDMEVSNISLNGDGHAVGVITSDGREIKGNVILSNTTPCVMYQKLIPEEILPKEFKSSVANIDYSSPVTKINVAVKKLPNFRADPNVTENQPMPHHQCTIHINCENTDLITQAYRCATEGNISERPMIEMVIPSSVDPTLAPSGCHVCLLFTQYTPYHLKNGQKWDDEKKKEYANMVFSNIEEYAPGFIESIVGMEVLAPPDLEEIFGLTGGNIYHGALSLHQLFVCRAAANVSGIYPPFTPIKNLLICGSGAHPGGGVIGAPGHIAAQAAIASLSTTRKK